MKKVLITGAAGTIGKRVIKYLLMEGKYEITVIDFKTRNNSKIFHKYHKRLNIVYGDICSNDLMEDLIRNADYVIHLASSSPLLGNLNKNLTRNVDYKGTETIVRLIDFYNPSCHLMYASSSSVYGMQNKNQVSTSTHIEEETLGLFAKAKLDSENIIKKKLSNYTIFRIPVVLCNPIKEDFDFSYDAKSNIEVITDEDVAYMFAKAIDKKDEINKKTYNVGGGEHSIISGIELNNLMLKGFGFTSKFIKNKMFVETSYYGYEFKDSDKLDEILNYRNDSVSSYFMRVRRSKNKHYVRKLLGKIFIKNKKKQ